MPPYYKTEPFPYQKEIIEKSKDEKSYGLFLEQGTGKTKIAIDTFNYLLLSGQIDAVAIICPKSLIFNWKTNEIPTHSKIPLETFPFYISNYENLKGLEQFLDEHNAILILDEASKIKNPRSQRTKNLIRLSEKATFRRILTGTPITQGVQDVFSLIEFLKRGVFGNYHRFSYRYLKMVRMDLGHRSFNKIVGYKNIEELHQILDQFCTRVLKSEVLDLPDKIYEKISVPLSKKQHEYYHQLRQELIVEVDEGILTTPQVVTKMLRLQQIVGGFLPLENQEPLLLDCPRMDVLMDLIEDQQKTIVWCRFISEIKELEKRIKLKHGDDTVVTFIGEKTQDQRQQAVEQFRNGNAFIFLGNPQTGGMGLTLVESFRVIYYSNDFSLENRLQSEDRVHRIGQKNNVTYIDLESPRTIDVHILNALNQKLNVSELALDFERGNL